jgi:hypothetical protein
MSCGGSLLEDGNITVFHALGSINYRGGQVDRGDEPLKGRRSD